ncbi:unnamed protein product [Lampetra fluviatilis]
MWKRRTALHQLQLGKSSREPNSAGVWRRMDRVAGVRQAFEYSPRARRTKEKASLPAPLPTPDGGKLSCADRGGRVPAVQQQQQQRRDLAEGENALAMRGVSGWHPTPFGRGHPVWTILGGAFRCGKMRNCSASTQKSADFGEQRSRGCDSTRSAEDALLVLSTEQAATRCALGAISRGACAGDAWLPT